MSLSNYGAVKSLHTFKVKKNEKNPIFVFCFILHWCVVFWCLGCVCFCTGLEALLINSVQHQNVIKNFPERYISTEILNR